jgi:iron complex outermembrane receptor protein
MIGDPFDRFAMNPTPRFLTLPLLLLFGSGCLSAAEISEKDYFTELPEVLTVTRLAQPLSETPGAVTIIDREMIRRSGARELADLLRLVPGYLVGGKMAADPAVAYHAPIDDFGTRNLVLIDGRSAYSSYVVGGTHRGLMTVPLADIERIEVLRGSNSATYGANAMFGVINIITRHTQDTQGFEAAAAAGAGGIRDSRARLGWGNEQASYRVTLERRKDDGYANAYDDKTVDQFHFRADFRPATDQEWFVAAGAANLSAGDGFPGAYNNGDPQRSKGWENVYLHTAWERRLSATDKIKLSVSFDEEVVDEKFPYQLSLSPPAVLQNLTVDFSGRARRMNVEFQHQLGLSSGLRAAWGAGYKREEMHSPPLYYLKQSAEADEKRVFGTLEWRLQHNWVVNAGLFVGDHSEIGRYVMPRLMANYHLSDTHTLRAGWTRSARVPTVYELFVDRRYDTVLGQLRYDYATGNLDAEVLKTEEIGYFGNWRDQRMTLDVRIYNERMTGVIDKQAYRLAGYSIRKVDDYVNARDLATRGVEWHLRWKPLPDSEIWLAHNTQHFAWSDPYRLNNLPPRNASTLAWFQRLPNNFDLGVIHSSTGRMTWRDENKVLGRTERTDIRLAKPFRIGATRGEAALVVQAAGGDYVASRPADGYSFVQERRAFGTLSLEF